MKRLVSWNVNGIRAAQEKIFSFLTEESPELLALQETKAQPEQLTLPFFNQEGYEAYFASAKRRGYSGVAVYTKTKPLSVSTLGIEEFDDEGRTLILEFPDYILINCYFPNSQEAGKRLDYKIAFNNAILSKCNELVKNGKNIILCGDYNVAHKPIDLTNPTRNEGNPGYLPEERQWMDSFIQAGYIDTFRQFNCEPSQYTWWSYRFQCRAKNIGWRIDYFCVNESFLSNIENATIESEQLGSDHCPISLFIK